MSHVPINRYKPGSFLGGKTMKKLFLSLGVVFLLWSIISSCGVGDGGAPSSTGTVALFATDDISDYKQVIATINNVELIHTGSGATCDVLAEPVNIDIANLSDILQLLDVKPCSPTSFNRIRLDFARNVSLIDATDTEGICEFVSFKDTPGQIPKILQCAGSNCILDINGAVNVLPNLNNTLALDFDLKDFEVQNFPDPGCTVTMRVFPLNASEINGKKRAGGYKESVSGFVSSLDTVNDTFTLTKGSLQFSVDYSGAMFGGSPQPGIDDLLDLAEQKQIKVKVTTEFIDLSWMIITASTVFVKADGFVSNLDLNNHTFTLSNQLKAFSIGVDYSQAFAGGKVEGDISQADVQVKTKLFGYDGTWFLAHEVEVDNSGLNTDD